MRSFGSKSSFCKQRNQALLDAYRHHIALAKVIRLDEIGELIVNSPAPRFWVSEERATWVVSAIMRGKPVLDSMRESKREMFIEIYNRVVILKTLHPDWPLCHLVGEVVNSPAPKFYMKGSSAIEFLFKIRNGENR